jgi:hypothetical protein
MAAYRYASYSTLMCCDVSLEEYPAIFGKGGARAKPGMNLADPSE